MAAVGLCISKSAAQQPGPRSNSAPAPGQAGAPGNPLPLGIPGPTAPLFVPEPTANATVPIMAMPGNGGPTDALSKQLLDALQQQQPPPGPYAGPLSNPLLSPGPNGLPKTTQPTPATQAKIAKYVARMLDPETTLDLITHQTRVMMLKGQPIRIQSGDEGILAVSVVTPKEILLQGKGVGATVLNIWFGDKNDPAKQETLTYLVRVFPDPEAKERLERSYKTLEDEINKYFKDTSIRLKVVGDKMVVSGRVRDYIQGGQVLQIIRSNMPGASGGGAQGANLQGGGMLAKTPIIPAGGVPDPAGENPLSSETFQVAGGPNIINLLEVAGEQQVQLRVVVCV
ncbi:MAG TPA: pilus assembly protein N-terminal domain-containing protein, partial [Urbifossiella sp.]